MPDVTYDCIPCDRPADEVLHRLVPQRPVREALGWYVQLWYDHAGTPRFERRTHGNYTDRWARLEPAGG